MLVSVCVSHTHTLESMVHECMLHRVLTSEGKSISTKVPLRVGTLWYMYAWVWTMQTCSHFQNVLVLCDLQICHRIRITLRPGAAGGGKGEGVACITITLDRPAMKALMLDLSAEQIK